MALGLPIIQSTKEVDLCPDCASEGRFEVHDVRCHGHSGPAVVLAENEKVIKARTRKPPSPAAIRLKAVKSLCKKHGVTVAEAAERWLEESYGEVLAP